VKKTRYKSIGTRSLYGERLGEKGWGKGGGVNKKYERGKKNMATAATTNNAR
jgi:hypothetical protein